MRAGRTGRGVGAVLALRPAHAWWARVGQINALAEAARPATWASPAAPGDGQPVARTFRDGHRETWWAVAGQVGPYGPANRQRAVAATTDPATWPAHTTWYLVTNLPGPTATGPADPSRAADVAEVTTKRVVGPLASASAL